ncbi:MAG TPA: MotA/TolQ/ExbB proton channel family protein, partial [Rhizomicrobium sp.]|nr:MotA/TolQ/ExbB proton channel family protein [Rhizomicrobium sp.]
MTLMRVLAPVLFVILAVTAVPAMAQQGPSAAPAGAPATIQPMAPPIAAPTTNVDTSGLAGFGTVTTGSFSVVESFLRADIIVKSVMVLLLLASLWSWTIIINKWIVLGGLKRKAARFEKIFWSGQSLDELYQQFAAKNDHPLAAVFVAALREWRRSFEGGAPRESQIPGIKERIDKAMNVTIIRETDGIERQLGFLATVGSVAPFIGLFGTVWGIMNSFSAIA